MLLSQNLRKGEDFVTSGYKSDALEAFWRGLEGPGRSSGESWRRFWGSWEVLGGLLVSRCRFVKKCEVFDPKLGSMLGQKNVFFDVENWKNGVPRGVAKKVRFWIDFLATKEQFLKVREMQK